MFVKRREYEEVKRLANKCFEVEKKYTELKLKLKHYESSEHDCDDFCEGCQHLIESEGIYCMPEYQYGVRSYKTKKCALDRKCKEYKAKECNE